MHSLVQSVKGAGTNTLACAVAIVTLLILHDQGRWDSRVRTCGILINSEALCRLSYIPLQTPPRIAHVWNDPRRGKGSPVKAIRATGRI